MQGWFASPPLLYGGGEDGHGAFVHGVDLVGVDPVQAEADLVAVPLGALHGRLRLGLGLGLGFKGLGLGLGFKG